MNDEIFSWLLTLQIVLPFFLLSVVLLIVVIRGKSRIKDTMRELILNVKSNESAQQQEIQDFLTKKLGLDLEKAKTESIDIVKQRKFFFRSFVSALLNKEIENLALLDDELSRVTHKYHKLSVGQVDAEQPAEEVEATSDAGEALQSDLEAKLAEIETLKEKNRSLQQEVHITLTTLNNIFSEYSSMFGEESTRKDMSVDQILTAMESFSGNNAGDIDSAEPAEDSIPEPESEVEETETAEDLEFDEDSDDEGSPLDNMPLEDVAAPSDIDEDPASEPNDSPEEPSWEDAFEESGDVIEDDKKD